MGAQVRAAFFCESSSGPTSGSSFRAAERSSAGRGSAGSSRAGAAAGEGGAAAAAGGGGGAGRGASGGSGGAARSARQQLQLHRHAALRPLMARTPAALARAFAARHQLLAFYSSMGELVPRARGSREGPAKRAAHSAAFFVVTAVGGDVAAKWRHQRCRRLVCVLPVSCRWRRTESGRHQVCAATPSAVISDLCTIPLLLPPTSTLSSSDDDGT